MSESKSDVHLQQQQQQQKYHCISSIAIVLVRPLHQHCFMLGTEFGSEILGIVLRSLTQKHIMMLNPISPSKKRYK